MARQHDAHAAWRQVGACAASINTLLHGAQLLCSIVAEHSNTLCRAWISTVQGIEAFTLPRHVELSHWADDVEKVAFNRHGDEGNLQQYMNKGAGTPASPRDCDCQANAHAAYSGMHRITTSVHMLQAGHTSCVL